MTEQPKPELPKTGLPNSGLPIVAPSQVSLRRSDTRNARVWLVHAVRIIAFAALLLALNRLAHRRSREAVAAPMSLSLVRPFLPPALAKAELTFVAVESAPSLTHIQDATGQTVAIVAQTSPQADNIVGYAGPNNVLLVLDADQRITAVHLANSSDTVDHVARVRASDSFWQQFIGWRMGEPNGASVEQGNADRASVDGVSGATLTSLAIAEAIAFRLSGQRKSLRFPEPITLAETQLFFPQAAEIEEVANVLGLVDVRDDARQMLGSLLRTGELVDGEVGYQGPTELLVAIDLNGKVIKARMRSSFDNEPYVRYTKQEASFWKRFSGKSLPELASLDLDAAGIEGVSGATMTSMAAARILVATAERFEKARQSAASPKTRPTRTWNWSFGELATATLAILSILWSLSRWRGNKRLRWLWQCAVVIVLVGVSGNLLSLALLAGWTRGGLAWRLAPGLVLLAAVAILAPMLLRRNVYCDHVCPHGIAQQWLRPLSRRWGSARKSASGSKRFRLLTYILYSTIGLAFAAAASWLLTGWPQQLTWLEPFDTYAWRIGISMSSIVWLASLILASREPMAYCRLACPTGKLLDYVKTTRTSDRWRWWDSCVAAVAISLWLYVSV